MVEVELTPALPSSHPIAPEVQSLEASALRSRRYLAAVVFTDIVGFSALVHRDEVLGAKLLERHRQVVRKALPAHGGREVSTAGDSFLLEFSSVLKAVQAVVHIQRTLAEQRAAAPQQPSVLLRASVHLADIERQGHDLYGDGVNVASRLLALSPPGGLALSATAHALVRQRLPLQASSIGTPPLKNIATPVEVFVVEPAALEAVGGVGLPKPAPKPAGFIFAQRRPIAALAAMLFVAALTVGGIAVWREHATATRSETTDHRQSIAVLPLIDDSRDLNNEYFSDGLSEELINALGQIPALRVTGRASSFQFKGKSEDPRVVGKILDVGHLLEGSVRRQGDRVRIVAALIRTGDGTQLWSRIYDRELKDIFAVQSEIARSVAGALELTLLGDLSLPAAGAPSNRNLAAHNALLMGSFYFERHGAEDLKKAIGHFTEALRLDPGYALADAKLSLAWSHLAQQYLGGAEAADAFGRARAAADRALQLNPDLADAHVALGWLQSGTDLNSTAAAPEFRRAMELAPADSVPKNALAYALACSGRLEEAVDLARQALAIDPLRSGWHFNLATYLLALGRYDEAEQAIRKAIELQPTASGNYEFLALINLKRGDHEAALRYAQLEPDEMWRSYAFALIRQAKGERQAADLELQNLIARYPDTLAFQIATVFAFRSDPDSSFQWLERAFAARDPGVGGLLVDPFLTAYRADPRFVAFAQKVGLPIDR